MNLFIYALMMHILRKSSTFMLIMYDLCFKQVLDMPAYEARQREYALKGHRHFYFMTLNGSEV